MIQKSQAPKSNNEKDLLAKIKKLENIVSCQKSVIQEERRQKEELAQDLYWHLALQRNQTLTSNEKDAFNSYYDYMINTPIRENKSRYYSLETIATMNGDNGTGNKKQKIGPIHAKMQQYGLVTTIKEPQKTDKNRINHFDIISADFFLFPDKIQLDSHGNWGGKRIAIHKDCGGICEGRMIYLCTKCGEDYIEHKHITEITEEEYANRQDFEAKLPSMEELDDFVPTLSLSDVERTEDRSDVESFHMAMKIANSALHKQQFALEYGTTLPLQEMIFDDQQERGPPIDS